MKAGGSGSASNKTTLEKTIGYTLSSETKEYIDKLRSKGTSVVDDKSLNDALERFKGRITPFTLKNIDESIAVMNNKIAKEKTNFVKARMMVERDYLKSLQNPAPTKAKATSGKPKYTGELEKLNVFNNKSDVKISSNSISVKNDGKLARMFKDVRFIAHSSGNRNARWDFDGVKKLRSLGVTNQTAMKNVFQYNNKLFYLKPAYDKTDTSKWKDIEVINVDLINNSRML